MNKLLREYVKSCDTCARSKAPGIAHLDSYSPCQFLVDLGDLLQWTYHGPPYCPNQEFNTGCGRSTHQNGPFHPLFQVNHGRRDSSVNFGRDRPTAWTPRGNYVRQRSLVCIQVLASPIWASWSWHSAIFNFLPWYRWTNRMDKPDTRPIPSLHCELPIGRLVDPTISSRVCL
jgi:hypothetical protein